MYHAPTILPSFLSRTFPLPAAATLQCAIRQLCRNASTIQPFVGNRDTDRSPRTTNQSVHARLRSQQSWQQSLRYPATWTRTYTTKPGEYGDMTEQDYRKNLNNLQELSLHDVRQILGKDMSKKKGNEILAKVQRRRMTGTLDHESKTPTADSLLVRQALTWLRKTHPMDEDKAIMKRIEREEGEKEKQFIAESDRMKSWYPQQSAETDGIYGKPMVDEFAKIWNKRQEEKIKLREERKRQYAELKANYEAQRITDSRDSPKAELAEADSRAVSTGQAETSEWVKRYQEKARLTDMLEPPKMSLLERLGPSYILLVIVLSLCAYVAHEYQAPPSSARMFPDWPVSVVTLQTIMHVNILIWLAWKIPPLWRIMNFNFIQVGALPKARSIVLAAFSHQSAQHLMANMIGLWLVGLPLHEEVGRGEFLAILIASAAIGNIVSLTRFATIGPLTGASLGASAPVCGIGAAWCWLPPRRDETDNDGFKQFGKWIGRPDLDDYTTWFWRAAILALIVVEFQARKKASALRIEHWAHIGGYIGGIASAEVLLWHTRRQKWLKEHPEHAIAKLPRLKPRFVTQAK